MNDAVKKDIKIVDIDKKNDGQNKCPKCGSTDISLNINTGLLRCNFCRHEFETKKENILEKDITKLKGEVLSTGSINIKNDFNDMITIKCSSCGAEVIINTNESVQARCHWCRNVLSINNQIPNGSIPDVLLPFKLKKEEAEKEIQNFVKKRKFYAHPKFKSEFKTDNIMGVYLPYMIVDINAHSKLSGEGEVLIRTYTEGDDEHRRTYYDADLYNVEREFDITIEGLTIESSIDKLNKNSEDKTTNIINSIMPFDIENCVVWDANYLRGFTSEKRDVNVDNLKPIVEIQSKDIARFAINDTLTKYNRGVAWHNEQFNIIGQQWKSAYLPIWLYCYQQVSGNKKTLHYVAVNARTKETMGSVPIYIQKLLLVSFLVEILGFFALLFVDFDYNIVFLLSGFIYFFIIYNRYRNKNARHMYELETKRDVKNVRRVDSYIKRKTRLSNNMILGVNNKKISNINFDLKSFQKKDNVKNNMTKK